MERIWNTRRFDPVKLLERTDSEILLSKLRQEYYYDDSINSLDFHNLAARISLTSSYFTCRINHVILGF
jgi:hypothetical protein